MGAGGGRREREAVPPGPSWKALRARSRRARRSRAGPAPRALRAPPAPAPSAGATVTAAPVGPGAERGGAGSPRRCRGRHQPAAAGRPGEWKRRNMAASARRSAHRPGSAASAPGRRGIRLRQPVHRRRGSGSGTVPRRSRSRSPLCTLPGPVSKRPFGEKVSRATSDPSSVVEIRYTGSWSTTGEEKPLSQVGVGGGTNRRNSPQSYWTSKS